VTEAMSEIPSDSAVVSALRQQMTLAAARQAVAASNLANVNTPGYRAREADFGSTLETKLGADSAAAIRLTHASHLAHPEPAGPATKEQDGLAARADGNNVQIDRELLSMTQAAGEFARAQTALAAKFRLVRYALNEAR
jgi:flagellar basal-body rod protein FlgB